MAKNFDNPVSNKVKFLQLLVKREDYLRFRKDKIDDKIQVEKEYNYELEQEFTRLEGAIREIEFLSQIISLLGVDNG